MIADRSIKEEPRPPKISFADHCGAVGITGGPAFFLNGCNLMEKQLRRAVKKSSKSQSEIARQIGVSRFQISHFINGRSSLSLARAGQLAKILGLKLIKA